SGRPFLPITPLQVSLSFPTWALSVSNKQTHPSPLPLPVGHSRVEESPAPLEEMGSRAHAVRGGEPDYFSGSFPPSEVTFHVPRASLSIRRSGRRGLHLRPLHNPLYTGPSRFPLQVVGPLGDGLASLVRAWPGQVPRGATQPPGALRRVPTPGLAPGWEPGPAEPGDVTCLDLVIKFGKGEWVIGSVQYEKKNDLSLYIIIPAVIVPMLIIFIISVYCYRRKSQQAEREYEKVKHQLENLEESVRDRCKKEFTDLMIEMEDHTNELSEGRIPFLDYKTYTDRVFFLPSKDGANDVMITGKLDIPEARRATVSQALNQFSNLLNSKTFLINFIRTLERSHDFNARAKVYFASLLTVALHGKLEYYTDIMRTLLLELMEEYVHSKNPKLMLRRSETVVERMLCNWMSICLYQFLKDTAGEPLYKLFRAIKHQIEKGPVDARVKKAKYTLNDTGLLGDDVEYSVLTLQVLVQGEGPDVTPVKVLSCDTISQVKEKIIEQVYRNLPYSQRPKVDSVTLEWRPGSTGQILSDLDLTSQKEGRWKRINTLAHYNVRDNATLVLSRLLHTQQNYDQNQENHEERNALLDDDKVFHLVRPTDELDEIKSKRGSIKDKSMTKAITEIYLTRLLSVK
ncbi:Plexin-B2, partial [Ataeniobius toweri]|nr:Plexin-B2 [Ataeniobius toweri]